MTSDRPLPTEAAAPPNHASLEDMLEAIRPQDRSGSVPVRHLLNQIAARSFTPIILVPSLILISPLSAIPGSPTLGMVIIVTVAIQAAVGRRHLWLPQFVMRRQVPAGALNRAIDWLEPGVRWIDRRTRNRWRVLTMPPADRVVFLAIALTALPWPVLEPLPMVTSIGAFAVSLFAIGLTVRDGLFVVAGFAFVGVLATAVASLLSASV